MYNRNLRLSNNFSLWEYVEWGGLTPRGLEENIKWFNSNPIILERIRAINTHLQAIRDRVETPITITSGLRSPWWEEFRKRNGKSQHVEGWAIDFIIRGRNDLMDRTFNDLSNWRGGLARSITRGGQYNFIHIDLGTRRRWTY